MKYNPLSLKSSQGVQGAL